MSVMDELQALFNLQQQSNQQTNQQRSNYNQVNQVTPYGNLVYSRDPSGRMVSTFDLFPQVVDNIERQRAGESQRQRLANAVLQGFDTSPVSFDGLPSLPGDYAQNRDEVEQALYQRQRNLMDPRYAQEQEELEQKLASQGLSPGGEGYDERARNFYDARNLDYENARLQAIMGGGQEQTRLFNMDLQGRQQGIEEQLTQRAWPVNTANSLLSRAVGYDFNQQNASPNIAVGDIDVMGPGAQLTGYDKQLQAAMDEIAWKYYNTDVTSLTNLSTVNANNESRENINSSNQPSTQDRAEDAAFNAGGEIIVDAATNRRPTPTSSTTRRRNYFDGGSYF